MTQEDRGGWEHSQQLRAVVGARVNEVIRAIVAGFGGRTVHSVRTRSLAWPGVNDVEPEPIACLEAARELERAAHAVQLDYIRRAREAGRSWYEIGDALDLHWAAVANKESIVDEAYSYAMNLVQRPGGDRRPVTWTCPACQEQISDHGPYGDLPQQQEGHATNCPRWSAQVADWQERHSQGQRWLFDE